MSKINTKNYGVKNILCKERIENTYDLYVAEINGSLDKSRHRVKGIIDDKNNEIYPFSNDLNNIGRIQAITPNIVIIDYVAFYGDPNFGFNENFWGSILLMRINGVFTIYDSDAAIIKEANGVLLGANFDPHDKHLIDCDYMSFPTFTFEYDYVNNCMLARKEFDKEAYIEKRLEQYLNKREKQLKEGKGKQYTKTRTRK